MLADGLALFWIGSALLAAFSTTSQPSEPAAGDPLAGTWIMDTALSVYQPGPVPSSETVTYVPTAEGLDYTVQGSAPDGSATLLRGRILYDEKDYPSTGTPDYDTVATRRIDARSSETVRKRNGKEVQKVVRVVSTDGKTLTLTTQGTDAKRQSIKNVGVYHRRP